MAAPWQALVKGFGASRIFSTVLHAGVAAFRNFVRHRIAAPRGLQQSRNTTSDNIHRVDEMRDVASLRIRTRRWGLRVSVQKLHFYLLFANFYCPFRWKIFEFIDLTSVGHSANQGHCVFRGLKVTNGKDPHWQRGVGEVNGL